MSGYANYTEALSYLYSFVDYEKLPGASPAARSLDNIEKILGRLGNPERNWASVHVTGTKGKGSTATMIAAMASASGYRVGLYTSPHLVSYRERMVVDGQLISEEDFCRLVGTIRPVLDDFIGNLPDPPSFFDVWTAMAFAYFAREEVDLAVVEVGLGGRLDSTNVLTPEVAVITPIGLDHTDRLGDTIELIAGEKAGIIKEGVPTVSAPQERDALKVIRQSCQANSSQLVSVGADIRCTIKASAPNRQVFDIHTSRGHYPDLQVSVNGAFQAVNAATAVGAVEILGEAGLPFSQHAISKGLMSVKLPGRLHLVQSNPPIILDGAHNVLGIRALVGTLATLFPDNRVIFVLSLNQDKDIPGVCDVLSRAGHTFILTRRKAVAQRQAQPEAVADYFREAGKEAILSEDVGEALQLARQQRRSGDVICVTGSFYLVGEAMEVLQDLDPEETLSRTN